MAQPVLRELARGGPDIVGRRGQSFRVRNGDDDDSLDERVQVRPFVLESRLKIHVCIVTQHVAGVPANAARLPRKDIDEVDFHARISAEILNRSWRPNIRECDCPIIQNHEGSLRRHRWRTVRAYCGDAADPVRRD